jgi:hypothetical protein
MLGIGAIGQYALAQFPQTTAPPPPRPPFIRYVVTVVQAAIHSKTTVGVIRKTC